MLKVILFALAGLSLASPSTFTLEAHGLPLQAVSNGTANSFVIKIDKSTAGVATPAFVSGAGQYKSLNFLIDGTTYGIIVPEVGDDYGHAFSLTAVKGQKQNDWMVSKGQAFAKPQAALDSLYECNDEADGKAGLFLKYGIYFTNGSPPPNCVSTVGGLAIKR